MSRTWSTPPDRPHYDDVIETALGKLDLDRKCALLGGADMWRLPAMPDIGLKAITMSDGPIGVRGRHWSATSPSIALPSSTAMAATFSPDLIAELGHLLAQEAHRKGVHVLLAPTVNLHRSPLGGRHFENFSEDPYLTGTIGAAFVAGVQQGGIATTMKHFVANDSETDRLTVNNVISERALRELYVQPFAMIIDQARPWGAMAAYNSINGTTATENGPLQNDLLRDELGFDGFIVSDWGAARNTSRALQGGLDIAMPGPRTVFGPQLAQAVRDGDVNEKDVDRAVSRVLLLAARTGALAGADPAVAPSQRPRVHNPIPLAREAARRSMVLAQNRPALGEREAVLPLYPYGLGTLAVSGLAARDARILGGGSATVFPENVISPLQGLRNALGSDRVTFDIGADPNEQILPASNGFQLRAQVIHKDGTTTEAEPLVDGAVHWMGETATGIDLATVDRAMIIGTYTANETGPHTFGTRGAGWYRLTVDHTVLFEGVHIPASADPLEMFTGQPAEHGAIELQAGEQVSVSLEHRPIEAASEYLPSIIFALMHRPPEHDAEALIAAAASSAAKAGAALVVVATTEQVESEGYDRTSLALPGRQDDLVRAVAKANPRTIVVVNTGSPVEMPWRNEVAAVLLSWFPGQEAGNALADVLLGAEEPGGRLPTTWPATLADAPVRNTTPVDGDLLYDEDVFVGYRAWKKPGKPEPAYWFGHGLGYTTWEYDSISYQHGRAIVRVTNTGNRSGREIVQVYVSPTARTRESVPGGIERLRLAGFASVVAQPKETVEVAIDIPARAWQIFDHGWRTVEGTWMVTAGRSAGDLRIGVDAFI
ncbi:beta-glucosidase family protein [Natronoglycomyces albus]|uniref:Glycoside hydrolase family 3 C-terminal domain-containing protein n=1 Tax=Natronoglycomyces albus TaxID=2811108 RepID=A0A895XHG8_9ACTN|nr:glycoside hydrolase family 3 C-terminal domain-containing protein [Natronoglycomyces albus]QSB04377.1 glycoside hydrolase family 3 C-terminal domain-containing protein [Natronoglycomyces albus]